MLMRFLYCSACRLLTFIKVWFHFTLSDSQQPKVRFYCAILYTPYTFLSSWDKKFSGGNGDGCNRWHRPTTRSYITALVYRTAWSERLACGRDLSKSVHIDDSATQIIRRTELFAGRVTAKPSWQTHMWFGDLSARHLACDTTRCTTTTSVY